MAIRARLQSPQLRSSLLWGLVGFLSFLVLHQLWILLGGIWTSVGVVGGAALVVGGVTTTVTYWVQEQLAPPKESL